MSLIKSIRSVTSSEEFCLSSCNDEQAVNDLMAACFTEPLDCAEMVKISFVVGAGKGQRSKYNGSLAKWVRNALNAVGYSEDKGACLMMSSQGLFKYQHDTGKNLIFIHVFPKLKEKTSAAAATPDLPGASVELSRCEKHKRLMGASSQRMFQEIIQTQTRTISQKKRAIFALRELKGELQEIEKKLMNGETLTDVEQNVYESTEDLDAKLTWLVENQKMQVKRGDITDAEKAQLIETLTEKFDRLKTELEKSKLNMDKESGNEKKKQRLKQRVDKLKAEQDKIEKRLKNLKDKKTKNLLQIHPLKNKLEMEEVWTRADDLGPPPSNTKMSLKEQKTLSSLMKLQEKFEELVIDSEEASWFEDVTEFQERVALTKTNWQRKRPKKNRRGGGGGGFGANRGWSSAKTRTTWSRPKTKQKKKSAADNPFAGMETSSSDEEE
eukprot:g3764.t1